MSGVMSSGKTKCPSCGSEGFFIPESHMCYLCFSTDPDHIIVYWPEGMQAMPKGFLAVGPGEPVERIL